MKIKFGIESEIFFFCLAKNIPWILKNAFFGKKILRCNNIRLTKILAHTLMIETEIIQETEEAFRKCFNFGSFYLEQIRS